MPVLQTTLHGLNSAFGPDNIGTTAANRNQFAPGGNFHTALANHGATPGSDLHTHLHNHLTDMPVAVAESIRAAVHAALSTKPPTHVNFAWAPGYDWEVTVWQAPDADKTKGGVTILIKSRYPVDRHPLKKKAKA